VISGPGGTLWGTNAVNGVINVLTRPARETHGGLVAGGAGTEGGFAHARFGAGGRPRTHWRVHGRFLDVDETERADGSGVGDAARRWQGGFRADGGDSLSGWMLTGGASRATIDQAVRERIVGNAHLVGAWTRRLAPGRNLRLQANFDSNERDQPGSILEELDTYDVELHVPFGAFGNHRVFTGAGYRHQVDRVENLGPGLAFLPAGRDLRFAHAFVEDAIRLGDDVDLDLGMKFEHNVYTHWEALPSLRLAWRPGTDHLLWTALSRAVRAPSRIDRELFIPAAPPHVVLAGGPDFRSEIVHVAELGLRAQPTPFVSYSITGFVHRSERLRSFQPSPDGPVFGNGFEGTTTGLEAWGRWRITPWWRVDLGMVELRRTLRLDDPAATGETQLGNDPHRWASLRSAFDLFGRHELDVRVRRVGALPNPAVPAYVAVDARLGIRLPRAVELSLSGWNVFERRHPEWGVAPVRPEFERGALAALRWRFWGS
jgi:iron complex outermembrane receptor protein